MTTGTTKGICTSGPGGGCPFTDVAVANFNGRDYCELHAPLDAPFKPPALRISTLVDAALSQGKGDFSGVVFPGKLGVSYRFGGTILARRCTFGEPQVVIRVEHNCSLDMSESAVQGTIVIEHNGYHLTADKTRFRDDALVHCNHKTVVELRRTIFEKKFTLNLQIGAAASTVRLDYATFAIAPVISADIVGGGLPQDSSFRELKLKKTAFGESAEARYRHIRNCFHVNRDREHEGQFYAYQMRALRQSLPWGPARIISTLYDSVARYGQSYERVFAFLVLLQVVFGLLYGLMSRRLACCDIDSQIVAFTLAQVVKPFDFLSARTSSIKGLPYDGIYPIGGGGWWTFVMALDSLLSLTLVALFFLALRWRFRRN